WCLVAAGIGMIEQAEVWGADQDGMPAAAVVTRSARKPRLLVIDDQKARLARRPCDDGRSRHPILIRPPNLGLLDHPDPRRNQAPSDTRHGKRSLRNLA